MLRFGRKRVEMGRAPHMPSIDLMRQLLTPSPLGGASRLPKRAIPPVGAKGYTPLGKDVKAIGETNA